MLKLLKVLLLDSKDEDRHCASPGDFAQSFLRAHGLTLLLHLSATSSSFDVKSMCVKLIDVLSSHQSMIKISVDPDVITYLSSVIVPKPMMEAAAVSLKRKNQIFNNLVVMVSNEDVPMHEDPLTKETPFEDFTD